jgi:hypothetical protein
MEMVSMTERRSAQQVYEIQRERDMAWSRVAGAGDPSVLTGAEMAYLVGLRREFDAADELLREVRAEIGGRVYRVPDDNLDQLAKRVAKINRRAAKLGVEPVHFVVTDETWVREVHGDQTGEVTAIVPHTFVVVGSQVVKLAGWRFAATIEHDEEGNIIRQVPGVEADLAEYRTAEPWCSHCETVRRRIDTFVVLHEDGHTEQVGRNCLVDFLGASAKGAAAQAEWLCELEDALEDAEDVGVYSGEPVLALADFLTHVALSIRTASWVSRGAAYEGGGEATADRASRNLRACRRGAEDAVLAQQEDRDVALAAIEWARATWCATPIDERSDFEHNMAVVVAKDYVPERRLGLAAYTVQGYRKAIEEEIRRRAVAGSQFIGEIGERLALSVTVARVVALRDTYSYNGGTKPLYLFVDEAGNSLKWFASSWKNELKVGASYELTGTVQRHDEDEKYGKATIVNRCKAKEVV